MEPVWGPVGAATVVRTWTRRLVEEARPARGEPVHDLTRVPRRLERAVALVRCGGTLLAVVQLAGDASPHETAVAAVLGDAARPATLTEAEVAALAAGPPPMSVERLRDVLRFDGVAQLWLALVTERGIDAALDPARRARLEAALAPWLAADGTLRIAVEAACLQGPVLKSY